MTLPSNTAAKITIFCTVNTELFVDKCEQYPDFSFIHILLMHSCMSYVEVISPNASGLFPNIKHQWQINSLVFFYAINWSFFK